MSILLTALASFGAIVAWCWVEAWVEMRLPLRPTRADWDDVGPSPWRSHIHIMARCGSGTSLSIIRYRIPVVHLRDPVLFAFCLMHATPHDMRIHTIAATPDCHAAWPDLATTLDAIRALPPMYGLNKTM